MNTPTNTHFQPADAPISQGSTPPIVVPWKYGVGQKIQGKQITSSSLVIKSPGTLSTLNTLLSTIGAGSTQFLTYTLTTQAPHGTELNFAIPYVSCYEGTSALPSRQVYPILGTAQKYGTYTISGDFDYNNFATASSGSVISSYSLMVHNNDAGAGTYLFVSQYKYLNFSSGTVIAQIAIRS